MSKYIISLLLLLIANSSFAAEEVHNDWVINTDQSDYFYAATVNNSGHVFGKYCYFDSEQCLYLVGIDITCTKGNEYPILINSDPGASSQILYCGDKVGNQNVLVFNDFDKIDNLAKEGKTLGIAIPMESGKFKVSRFSLSGSTYSIQKMTAEAEKKLSTVDSEFL
ncbi:hypothetical protein [Aliivibrio fischeri]|uniref:Signal peptide protein n=1 Tax=Aliivibrio fischeri SR5 TaxID=1088719 RepID=A0AAV3EM38_ALIFS|nr:hypothetical protein [Aliivibrio fischeri]EHN67938.1 putative signal peptide protein [Aliivibrio fischeri SR5]